jgi:hypothetical protein
MWAMRRFVSSVVLCGLAACSPTLDWRELRPAGSGAQLMFPCKPSSQTRPLELAGVRVPLTLHVCTAGGATYALAVADVGEAGRIAAALTQLGDAAARNLSGEAQELPMPRVAGATPQPQARRLLVRGHLPDGSAAQQQLAVFSHGTRIYQASVLGASLDGEGVETFLGSIRLSD